MLSKGLQLLPLRLVKIFMAITKEDDLGLQSGRLAQGGADGRHRGTSLQDLDAGLRRLLLGQSLQPSAVLRAGRLALDDEDGWL